MTIQQQIEALKKEFADKIAELEKQLAKEKKNEVWKPKKGDSYWVLCAVNFTQYTFDDDATDDALFIRGNMVETKEEAEWEDMHRIVATELKHFVQENDPRPITEEDWEDISITKKYLNYNTISKTIEVNFVSTLRKANQVYASDVEVLKKAIDHIGEDRLKKYYFGVGK